MRIYLEPHPMNLGQRSVQGWQRLLIRFKNALRTALVIELGHGIPKE